MFYYIITIQTYKKYRNVLKERESGGIYETDIMLWRF